MRRLILLIATAASASYGCSSGGGPSDGSTGGGQDAQPKDATAMRDSGSPGTDGAMDSGTGGGSDGGSGGGMDAGAPDSGQPADSGTMGCAPIAFTRCSTGAATFECGPGTTCTQGRCTAAAGCGSVVCDRGHACRGIGCPGMNENPGTPIIAHIASVPAGSHGSVAVTVTASGAACLTLTVEEVVENGLYTSAGNDNAIWYVTTATKTQYVSGVTQVNGLAVEGDGTLVVVRNDCSVARIVGTAGGQTVEVVGQAPAQCSRIAVGPDGALYAAGGASVARIDPATHTSTTYATIPVGTDLWFTGQAFISGLAFLPSGTLIVSERWPALFTIKAGTGGTGIHFADAPLRGLNRGDDPWNEGLSYGPDGNLYGGVFPCTPSAGFLYRVQPNGTSTTVLDLPRIHADVAATQYTGIHGIAFGLDGSLYFANQNTNGNTGLADGQVLALRPSGHVELIQSGFNFNWPLGYDGDLVIASTSIQTVTAAFGGDATAHIALDAPPAPGPFEIRVLVTDPQTGRIISTTTTARAL